MTHSLGADADDIQSQIISERDFVLDDKAQ